MFIKEDSWTFHWHFTVLLGSFTKLVAIKNITFILNSYQYLCFLLKILILILIKQGNCGSFDLIKLATLYKYFEYHCQYR